MNATWYWSISTVGIALFDNFTGLYDNFTIIFVSRLGSGLGLGLRKRISSR